jgi:hypothetical protein
MRSRRLQLTSLQLGFLHHWLPSPQANGEALEGGDGAAAAEDTWTSAFMEPGSSSLLAQHSYQHDCRPLQAHHRRQELLGDAHLYFPPMSSTAEQFPRPISSPLNLLQDELLQVVVRHMLYFAFLCLFLFLFFISVVLF